LVKTTFTDEIYYKHNARRKEREGGVCELSTNYI